MAKKMKSSSSPVKKTESTTTTPKKTFTSPTPPSIPLGPRLSFGASEAYKLLRANLLFSANAEERCQIIGITSSVRGEGKSTTSMNLSYTFAEAGKRVLLVDGDMRLPQIAKILALSKMPGLSNYLAGMTKGKAPIQPSGLHNNLSVISSGDIPPNPSELLGSDTAVAAFKNLSEQFDYIIIDLPPVNIVSDALVLSNICDGYLIVVRQDYTSRRELTDCVDQMQYVKAKLLGFVMTHSTVSEKGKYRGKRYYNRYGNSRYGYKRREGYYGAGYGSGYGHTPADTGTK